MEQTQSIEFPDGPAIPEMREALLDPDKVRELASDLARFTRVFSIQCKTSARSQTPPAGDVSLEQATELLLSRNVQAIQVKYHYEDHEWTDTLMQFPSGVRLVRCRHEPVAE
jgi:hypothetical protein